MKSHLAIGFAGSSKKPAEGFHGPGMSIKGAPELAGARAEEGTQEKQAR